MRRALNIMLTVLLTIGFILLGVFVFATSYIRFWHGLTDFGLSFGYYFCVIFGIPHNITPTVNNIDVVQTPQVTLPNDFEGFKSNASQYFSLLFNGDNFNGWLAHISGVMGNFAEILIILIPCLIVAVLVIRFLYRRENNKHGVDTIPLRIFKFLAKIIYRPVKMFIAEYIAFIRRHGWILKCWIVLWVFHFNLATVIIEFLAYYFYFAVEYDFATIYTQFVKLFADLKTPFVYFPWWTLLLIIYPLFDKFRKRIATSRLRHFEARNCGFINELPIVSMACGSMGKKKTTAITDMALSQEVMFRQKALEILQTNDMKFPYFKWIVFEKAMQAEIANGNPCSSGQYDLYGVFFERGFQLLKKGGFLTYISSSTYFNNKDFAKLDRITLNALIGALFNDGRDIKKIKKQERPNDFVNQAIVNGINSLPKQSLWEYFIASPSYLGTHYQEIRDYRDLIMHAKNISYQKFVDMSCAIKKGNQELNILIPRFANESIYLTTPLQKEIDKIAKKLFNLSSKN